MKKKLVLLLLPLMLLTSCVIEPKLYFIDMMVIGYDDMHTEIQLNYINSDNYEDTTPYSGNLSKSAPNPISFSWNTSEKVDKYKIYISKDEGFKDALVYEMNEPYFDFYNALYDTTYYYMIESDNIYTSDYFTTGELNGPRNLYIDGVENVRDLAFKGKIKQGYIYRSGRFNEEKVEEVTPSITELGLKQIKELNIKTEIDLRRTSTNEVGALSDTSVLGDDVNYIQLPMAFGGNNILTFTGTLRGDDYQYNNPQEIKKFFDILADENNYPIDFHCSIGKDRTGCLAYLLEGLLGIEEEYLMRDYMFTNFANAGYCKPEDINTRYVKTLKDYEVGEALQEKIYNYLSSENIGVSSANLDKIIEILKDY